MLSKSKKKIIILLILVLIWSGINGYIYYKENIENKVREEEIYD